MVGNELDWNIRPVPYCWMTPDKSNGSVTSVAFQLRL